MFENKLIPLKVGKINAVHVSRIIASWRNKGGDTHSDEFEEWLHRLGLSDDDVSYVFHIANNGKLELEMLAKAFMMSNR